MTLASKYSAMPEHHKQHGRCIYKLLVDTRIFCLEADDFHPISKVMQKR